MSNLKFRYCIGIYNSQAINVFCTSKPYDSHVVDKYFYVSLIFNILSIIACVITVWKIKSSVLIGTQVRENNC